LLLLLLALVLTLVVAALEHPVEVAAAFEAALMKPGRVQTSVQVVVMGGELASPPQPLMWDSTAWHEQVPCAWRHESFIPPAAWITNTRLCRQEVRQTRATH
jgi:hypothetical protein